MRRLVSLSAHEGRPVALGEERESEADDEERCRDHRIARVSGERERSEPQTQDGPRERPRASRSTTAQRRPQQPRDEDCSREGDERGEQQSQIAVATPARELEHDESDRGKRRRIQEPEPGSRCPRRDRAHEDGGRGESDDQRQPKPFGREDAAGEHVPDGCARPLRHDRASDRADREPDRRARQRERARLRHRDERQLPTARAVPGKPPAGCSEIRAQRHRRQQREREQERRRLTADDPEPAPRRTTRRLRLAKLLDRRDEVEARRDRLELRTRLRHTGREVVDLPETRSPRSQRNDPGVAAVERVERRRPGERPRPLGEEERRRRRPVVPSGSRHGGAHLGVEERVVGRGEEVAEEDAVVQHCFPDLDDPQSGWMGQPPLAAQAQHLAAHRRAGMRQTPGPQGHPVPEPLDSAEAREGACNRRLAEEDERGRGSIDGVPERDAGTALERGLRLVALGGNAEPDRPHRAAPFRNPLDGLRDGPILRDERAGAASEDDGRACGDPEHDQDDGGAAPPEPRADETQRIQRRTEAVHAAVRSTRSAVTAASPSRRPTSSCRSASGGPCKLSTSSEVPSSRATGRTSASNRSPDAEPAAAAARCDR